MNPQEVRQLFDRIREGSTEPEVVARLCDKYLSEQTPAEKLSIMGATIDSLGLIRSLRDETSGRPLIDQLREGLTSLLHQRGYRNGIETHQEHLLCGSSGSGLDYDAKGNPYTVAGFLSGSIESVDAARKARDIQKTFGPGLGVYWGVDKHDDTFYRIILGPIDDLGRTISDPVLIDGSGNVVADRLVGDAPYKR